MEIINLNDYDITNYKLPSMFVIFPKCSFKCDKEFGTCICQNSSLAHEPSISIDVEKLAERYVSNPLTHAIVCGGLEPFDTFEDLYMFITALRKKSDDTVVIYTGYYPNEIESKLNQLKEFSNIIIKFGRYIPNSESKYDKILGITLASNNQYAEVLS